MFWQLMQSNAKTSTRTTLPFKSERLGFSLSQLFDVRSVSRDAAAGTVDSSAEAGKVFAARSVIDAAARNPPRVGPELPACASFIMAL